MNFIIGIKCFFCCDFHLFVSLLSTFFFTCLHLCLVKSVIYYFFIEERLGKVQTKNDSLSPFSFPVWQNVQEVYY